jgi:two-component system chemotaxis response regulator CheB
MSLVVTVGGSAGGIEALGEMVGHLPPDLPATVLVVIHVPATYPSRLPEILARRTPLDVAHATDGEELRPGTIRLAPPDHHLMVRDGRLVLSRGPRSNRHRPSIDVLFRSAARWHGAQTAAVILSGAPGDGIVGLAELRSAGATVLIQDPDDAVISTLPERALEEVGADRIGSAAELGAMISELVRGSATPTQAQQMTPVDSLADEGWQSSRYACPECSGTLWERDVAQSMRFRCRVGHAFAGDALMDSKADELEGALWSAINVMEERAELSERLASRAVRSGFDETARRYQLTSVDMRQQARHIRGLLAADPGFRLESVASPAGEPAVERQN